MAAYPMKVKIVDPKMTLHSDGLAEVDRNSTTVKGSLRGFVELIFDVKNSCLLGRCKCDHDAME